MIPVGTNLQRNKLPIATLALVATNVVFFIFELLLPEDSLKWVIMHLGFGPATRNPFAPFVSMFLHGDIYHVASNMLFLWVFGGPVEERVGVRNFLIYYLGAGLTAGFLNVIMELIARPDSITPSIGASGAVSGVMALFLYRCFYSKLRLVISPILLPRQINIPVIPLVIFWIFQDVLFGIVSMSQSTGIAHWAHVGGFAFGIVTGRIKRYGHEGQVEQLRGKILGKLEAGGGWEAAEKELHKLLEVAPDDPEVNHDLARLYASRKQTKTAERHFQSAIQKYFVSDPASGAYTVSEAAEALSHPLPFPYHIKAAQILAGMGEYEDAYKALLPVWQVKAGGALAEKGLVLFIRICRHLGKADEAFGAIRVFMEEFPDSKYKSEVRALMSTKAGEVFKSAPASSATTSSKAEEKEGEALGRVAFFEQVFADPAFWSILLFVNIAAPILFPAFYRGALSPVFLFGAAFGMTIVHRMGSVSDFIFSSGRPSEKDARMSVDLKRCFEDAVMAEKRGRYTEAAELYEQYLKAKPKEIQARFNLARTYEKRLGDPARAGQHYALIVEALPESHPLRRDALDSLASLKTK